MRLALLTILAVLYPTLTHSMQVTLLWDAVVSKDLDHYTLYQSVRFEGKTGPWLSVQDIPKALTVVTVNVEDGKNFAWYVTATDVSGNQTQASNTVCLYDNIPPDVPLNFRKKVEGE